MSVRVTPEAEDDFANLVGHLVEHDPTAAAELGRRVFAIIDRLAGGDFEGPEQTLRSGEVVRSWPAPPVRIYYRRHASALWIVRIYHQSRIPIIR